MELIKAVDGIIIQFRSVFSHKKTFSWFVIIIFALMLRLDMAGITSVIRCFGLHPSQYFNLLHFFHSSAFSVVALCQRWFQILQKMANPLSIYEKNLFIIDAIKTPKAGKKMPGVRLQHQESDDNSKPEYIMGHFWGAVCQVITGNEHNFAVPLRFQIQNGIKTSPSDSKSVVEKMADLVIETLPVPSIIVADAYYSCRQFITSLKEKGHDFIGKVRSNAVGYQRFFPGITKPHPGRPKKYGEKVKLSSLFKDKRKFKTITFNLNGEPQDIRYYTIDLYWCSLWVRFVLTINSDGKKFILVSSNVFLPPEAIIYSYFLRFKIEVTFKSLTHVLLGFAYHFWMMTMRKIRQGEKDLYLHHSDPEFRKKVNQKIEAYERFVNIAGIALGILQVLSINFRNLIWDRFPVWLRTLTKHGYPSEMVVRLTMQNELHRNFLNNNDYPLLAKILSDKPKHHYSGHPLQLAPSDSAINF